MNDDHALQNRTASAPYQDTVAREEGASVWRRWLERPQRFWVRKALFQVHLWVGIGIGLYIVLISVTGSMVVYRRELSRKYGRGLVTVVNTGHRMSAEELKQRAINLYPGYTFDALYQPRRANWPVEIEFERNKKTVQRLFDPYTGADLGDPVARADHAIQWVTDLHDNLLAGTTGRFVNGIGAILVTLLALTGMIVWWPGVKNWRRGLTFHWKSKSYRFNWELHSALGFWCSLLILLWGVSGIYFSFPRPFDAILDSAGSSEVFRDNTLGLLAKLHFGRFSKAAEVVWTVLGLVPAALFVTGFLMWWKRVLRRGVGS